MTRVLVVDDEPCLLRGMKVLLTLAGHDSFSAGSAGEALASDGVFDVGVFDLDLDGNCGIELALRMLADGRIRRALFCTGSMDPEQITRARSVATVFIKGEPVDLLLKAIGARHPAVRGTGSVHHERLGLRHDRPASGGDP